VRESNQLAPGKQPRKAASFRRDRKSNRNLKIAFGMSLSDEDVQPLVGLDRQLGVGIAALLSPFFHDLRFLGVPRHRRLY
jgi:hypothetical protein